MSSDSSRDIPSAPREMFYRYDVVRYSLGVDECGDPLPGSRIELRLGEYEVLNRTPKGAWIGGLGYRRFVLLTARKQYACETVELAAESFRARKRRQIKILSGQLAEAEYALRLLSPDESVADALEFEYAR